jgi:hypothetical protein
MAETEKRRGSLSASVFEQENDAVDRAPKADDARDKTACEKRSLRTIDV